MKCVGGSKAASRFNSQAAAQDVARSLAKQAADAKYATIAKTPTKSGALTRLRRRVHTRREADPSVLAEIVARSVRHVSRFLELAKRSTAESLWMT